MNITIAENETAFDHIAAWRVIRQILIKPKCVIGLSTGRTTTNLHRIITEIHTQYPFDVSNVTFFGLDEVTNVPREYAGACYTMLRNEIIDGLGVREDNFIMLPTISDDFELACRMFQEEIEKRGGVDLLVLGLGENGHLGFNQPFSPFGGETWVTKMDARLEERIRKETNTPSDRELGGATLGLKNIMQARNILLVAKGAHKANIVKEMMEGAVTEAVPASLLQLHRNCEFLLDIQSAVKIRG